MKFRQLYDLLKGKRKGSNPPNIDLPHIFAVIQSWIRSLIPPPKHIREQIIWRRGEVVLKSPECWRTGACVFCGCEIIPKTTADIGCENDPPCYPEMMDKKKWKEFKKTNNINLF